LILAAVDFALDFNVEFCVFHIPGKDSIVANALSHFQLDILATSALLLHISHFLPPQLMLGAASL
jgi:hypothetical protein